MIVPKSTLPPGTKIIGSKWVFKRKAGGTYKAILVAQSWNLVQGIDCGGDFSPACRVKSTRMVPAIAAEQNWEVLELDVQTEFLIADIEGNVYVVEPPGFEFTGGPSQAMKLLKKPYGLPDSTTKWWNTIDLYLVEIILESLKSDTFAYAYTAKKRVLATFTLYADDLLLLRGDGELRETLTNKLMSRFKMNDIRNAPLALGMKVARDRERGTLAISQEN